MRLSTSVVAVVLCAASLGLAQAQQTATSNGVRVPPGTNKIPSGMSFAYDGQRHEITATGVQLIPSAKSKNARDISGTISVTINIKVVSTFREETGIRCSVTAIGGLIDLNNGGIDGGIETANGIGRVVSPGMAACTLTIPYSWTLVQTPTAIAGLILAFGAAAENEDHDVIRSTLQVYGIDSLPGNGATSSYAFDVSL